jgi:hypothetical protein
MIFWVLLSFSCFPLTPSKYSLFKDYVLLMSHVVRLKNLSKKVKGSKLVI